MKLILKDRDGLVKDIPPNSGIVDEDFLLG
jgi:hypothetical protein